LESSILLFILFIAAPLHAIAIHPHPILSEKRLELTRRYCKDHYGLESAELKEPRILVIHSTDIKTLKGSFAAFAPDTLSPSRKELSGHGDVNVGVHFLIDRNGDVYSLLPLNVIGRHAIGLNHVAIGIENVGFPDQLTPEQLAADLALVEDLIKIAPSLTYLIGHYEYTDKSLPHFALFKDLDTKYRPTVKSDPGRKFMSALRKKLVSAGITLAD
jgi:N-acetyl-anhydromuramyl-L-alanine amidase AmpD